GGAPLATPRGGARSSQRWREATRGAVPRPTGATGHAPPRRAHQPPRRGVGGLVAALLARIPRHRRRRDARSILPRRGRRVDPRARSRPRLSLQGELLGLARTEEPTPRPG